MAFWTRSLPLLALIAVLAPTASQEYSRQHLCGAKLVDTLIYVCSARHPIFRGMRNVEEFLANEVEVLSFQTRGMKKRGIVEECCEQGCTLWELQRYC